MNTISDFVRTVSENIGKVIVGKTAAVELLLVSLFCEGHVLIEDVPGIGKTMLARSLAASLGGSFKRVQCTPDLLPNDITGVSIYNQQSTEFEFRTGPVFVNILLADEINRATPRTQAALLEAMQERQVTVDGITHNLPRPFLVLATQNPIEYEGTFPLPEAQLDRFIMRISMGYPDHSEEKTILRRLQREHPIDTIDQVAQIHELLALQKQVWEINVDDTIEDYIVSLVAATREHPDLTLGASPRASLALFKAGQALAALRGRDHVIPDDIKYLTFPSLAHRLILRPERALRGRTARSIINEILEKIPVKLE